MKRISAPLIAVIGLLTLIAASTPAHAVYTVILKDGSFIKAAEKPVVEGGFAVIRLPNGLLAQIDARRINWKRSNDISSQAELLFAPEKPKEEDLPQPKKEIEGTITMTGVDETGAGTAGDGQDESGKATSKAQDKPANDSDALSREVQAQIDNVDALLQSLRDQKRQLESQAVEKKYNLDAVKSIRAQIAEIDTKIRLAEQERARMVRDLRRP